ncbi:MAG TPA: glycosyltransferase [Candidatus Omnitrophota bacterium]|nr:glycosyltransferase [Candidatus Omnitrophota bacterium]
MQSRNDMDKRRVLLMYITRVSGHRQATLAIQQALRKLDPGVEAPTVNGFGYTYPVLERVVNQAYMSVIKATPVVWDYIYDNPKVVKNTASIKNFLHRTSHDKIKELFGRYRPDTVVCTQAFPCGMVADYKQEHHLETKLIGVLTDFAPHSFWINEGVDYYIVPTVDTKERFIKKGVPADMIKVYGIPVRPKFAMQLDRRPIAADIGFDPEVPTILVMGGGQGLGPIKKIVKSLLKVKTNFQIIVLAGTNKKIVDQLQKEAKKAAKRMLVYEFASNVDEFMELASLIITKPGGITTAECLAKGLPMMIVNPLPGQERRNTDFLIQNGIGIRIDDTNDVGEEIEILLKSPERLVAMSKAAYTNAKPHATLDIARLILGYPEDESILNVSEDVKFDFYV